MKKSQTLHLKFFLFLSCLLISPALFAESNDVEGIWLYVILIPIYFVLALQCLLVLLALLMKHFKTKQSVFLSIIIASVVMLIGISVTYYHESMDKLLTLLLHFSLISIFVFLLPFIQYQFLKRYPRENGD
jgi:predicted neutral ceramidase superfamily lipid hydrolase